MSGGRVPLMVGRISKCRGVGIRGISDMDIIICAGCMGGRRNSADRAEAVELEAVFKAWEEGLGAG